MRPTLAEPRVCRSARGGCVRASGLESPFHDRHTPAADVDPLNAIITSSRSCHQHVLYVLLDGFDTSAFSRGSAQRREA